MRKFSGHTIAVDQGEAVLFSDFEDNGPMWSGDGQREVQLPIKFSEHFDAPPAVSVNLAMCDMSNKAFMRLDLRANDITNSGFVVSFKTWGDTKVARVRVAWQAIGSVYSDDAWDI